MNPGFPHPLRRDDAAPPGLDRAADLIVKGMEAAIANKTVTYDFERLMEGPPCAPCSQFART